MKRYIKYDYDLINKFVNRALDIKENQFSNWRSIQDIKLDENIQNLGEVLFGLEYEQNTNYQEAVRRLFEETVM